LLLSGASLLRDCPTPWASVALKAIVYSWR
jgi:hypothetical protein